MGRAKLRDGRATREQVSGGDANGARGGMVVAGVRKADETHLRP
jgi:hypothetical protein